METEDIKKDEMSFYKLSEICAGCSDYVKFVHFTNYSIGLHSHDFYELNFVVSGEGYHFIGNNRFYVSKGDIFVVPIGTSHGYTEINDLSVTHLLLSEEIFGRYQSMFNYNKEFILLFRLEPELKRLYNVDCFLKLSENELEKIISLLNNVKNQQNVDAPESINIIDGIAICILFQIFYIYRQKSANITLETQKISLISKILECIFESENDEITINKLSEMTGYSRSQFFRLFENIMHTTPGAFILKCRIETAKQLLKNKTLSVTEIGQSCGFFDSAHFIRTFKRFTGLTPGQYRRKS